MAKTPATPVFQVNTGPLDFGTAHLPAVGNYDEYQRAVRDVAADLVYAWMDDHKSLLKEAVVRYIRDVGCPDTPAKRREYGAACLDAWATQQIAATAVALRRAAISGPSRSEP